MRSPGRGPDLPRIERCFFEFLRCPYHTCACKRRPTPVNLAERPGRDRVQASSDTVRWPRRIDARSTPNPPALRSLAVRAGPTRGRAWLLRCFLPAAPDDAAGYCNTNVPTENRG